MKDGGFHFPNNTERVAVVGMTGSGKTRFGAWLLSHAPYDKMPYVIVNFKDEELFNGIHSLKTIGYNDLPKQPGLYQITPRPDEEAELEAWLWKVWERGKIGLYFDETLQIPGHFRNGAFKAILTQGRSKRIPCIMCSQRPAGVSVSVFSEADYIAAFYLGRRADLQRMHESGIPDDVDLMHVETPAGGMEPLPRYHSTWYDVKRRELFRLKPVEDDAKILARFNTRLRPRSRWF